LHATAPQSFCGSLAHATADHDIAALQGSKNSGVAVGLVIGGMVIARALGVRMFHPVGL
jgi:hypothetical protein